MQGRLQPEPPMITVSIIIPVYNRRDDLRRCLASIRSCADEYTEVIIVDDNSDESHADLCAENDTYIRNDRNLGPSYARNLAASLARGRILLFLDSDVEILPGSQQAIIDILDRADDIGCVGGSGPPNEVGDDVAFVKAKHYDHAGRNLSVTHTAQAFQDDYTIACDHFESANLAIRKSVFEQIGGFDPYWFYMGEDREFCLRLRRAGYRVLVDWRARAIHHESELDHKRKDAFLRFLAKRFLEVSFKLDGYSGAAKWLLTNRGQILNLRPIQLGVVLQGIRQLTRRRGMCHLEPERMREYVEHVVSLQQR